MAQFEVGFGSVCSIHSVTILAPAEVFLPMAIITFRKYPDHKVVFHSGVAKRGKALFSVNDFAVWLYVTVVLL